MAKKYEPRPYQVAAQRHQIEEPFNGLLIDMGLGKTVVTLTSIVELIDRGEIKKVLIIGPKRVCQSVWRQEAETWQHTKHLRFSLVLGKEKARKLALTADADCYVINRENVPWLVALYGGGRIPFDMVVVDEFSSFKNHKSQRFKSLRMVRPYLKRLTGLTGTPSPNGLLDLWAQLYLIDRGERLGKSITKYREEYFRPLQQHGHVVYSYELRGKRKEDMPEIFGEEIYEKAIYDKISDVCISMKTEDYLQLPDLIENDVFIDFDKTEMKRYEEFEREQVLQLPTAEDITAANAAGLTNKLMQYTSGAVYDEDKQWHHVHDLKLDALEEIISEANGENVFVFYNFKSSAERLIKRFGMEVLKTDEDVVRWNQGKVKLMGAHPASAGHGLNLQHGGSIMVWYDMNYSLELYEQANKRLHRSGQTRPVTMHRLIVRNTIDEDVLSSLVDKGNRQNRLMQAVKARIEKYLG